MVYAIRTAYRTFKVGFSENPERRFNEYCTYGVKIQYTYIADGSEQKEHAIQKCIEKAGFKRQTIKNLITGKTYSNEFFQIPKGMKASEIENALQEWLDTTPDTAD